VLLYGQVCLFLVHRRFLFFLTECCRCRLTCLHAQVCSAPHGYDPAAHQQRKGADRARFPRVRFSETHARRPAALPVIAAGSSLARARRKPLGRFAPGGGCRCSCLHASRFLGWRAGSRHCAHLGAAPPPQTSSSQRLGLVQARAINSAGRPAALSCMPVSCPPCACGVFLVCSELLRVRTPTSRGCSRGRAGGNCCSVSGSTQTRFPPYSRPRMLNTLVICETCAYSCSICWQVAVSAAFRVLLCSAACICS
jgi:hypothetical protein